MRRARQGIVDESLLHGSQQDLNLPRDPVGLGSQDQSPPPPKPSEMISIQAHFLPNEHRMNYYPTREQQKATILLHITPEYYADARG